MSKQVVDNVIEAYGGIAAIKTRFGYKSDMAVYQWRWRGLPRSLLLDIHVDTGIDLHRLREGATQPDASKKAV